MLKSIMVTFALVVFTGGLARGYHVQKAGPHEAEFKTFYQDFLKAARANDKEKIADLITFPVSDWSIDKKGNVTTEPIKDREEFLKRYDVLFTSYMRLHIPKGKAEPIQDGRYIIIWDDRDVECSFEISYVDGAGFRITSYSIGPR